MARDRLAFAAGLTVFVALYALYWLVLAVRLDNAALGFAVVCFGYAVPLLAGGVAAYISSQHQFAVLLLLGVTGAVAVSLINFAASSLGARVDFPGASSIPTVAVLSLLVQVPLVLVGGAIVGLWLRSRHA